MRISDWSSDVGSSYLFAVRIEIDPARLLQGAQRFDHSGHFHPVVGRLALASDKLPLASAVAQNRSPAAGARVALAGPVGENFDRLHGLPPPASTAAPASR